MRKLIGTLVVVAAVLVGLTGLKLSVNGKKFKIPPYIYNIFKSNELEKTSKEVQEKALDVVETVVNDKK